MTETYRAASSAGGAMDAFCFGPQRTAPFETVSAAFLHQVREQPNAIAAYQLSGHPRREITYLDLARRSAALAGKLRHAGVAPGERVPLVVRRGIDMLIGIFAVLLCGAQYVPLDGGVVPDSTLLFVLEQTGGKTVIAVNSTQHRLDGRNVRNIFRVDDATNDSGLCDQETEFQDSAIPDAGCYVIYTSGRSLPCPHQKFDSNIAPQAPRGHRKGWMFHIETSRI